MSRFYDCIQEYEGLAFSILLDIGAIKYCDIHDDWYYSTGMEEKLVYALATERLKEKKLNPDFALFQSFIKTILDNAGDSAHDCPFCRKMN